MPETITYNNAVRSFDHSAIAGLDAYPALREALNAFANQCGASLAEALEAVRDMVLTAPYADCCDRCRQHPDYLGPNGDLGYLKQAWPHAVVRDGGWLTCTYRCPRCAHTWTCGYSVHAVDYV